MIFVLANVIYIVYDRKNENHWSLLITHYSLLITHYSEYKHPTLGSEFIQYFILTSIATTVKQLMWLASAFEKGEYM